MDQDSERSFQELKTLLKQNLSLADQNNRMLRSMRNAARFQSFMRLVYLVLFIGSLIWSYNFIKPYLDQIRGTYQSYQNTQSEIQNTINKFLPKR